MTDNIVLTQTSLGFVIVSQAIAHGFDYDRELSDFPIPANNGMVSLAGYTKRKPLVYRITASLSKTVSRGVGGFMSRRDSQALLERLHESESLLTLTTPTKTMPNMIMKGLTIDITTPSYTTLVFTARFVEQLIAGDYSKDIFTVVDEYRNAIQAPINEGLERLGV